LVTTEPSAPLISLLAKTPVEQAPMMPPMQWTPNASEGIVHSPSALFSEVAAKKQITPAGDADDHGRRGPDEIQTPV